MTRNGQQVDQIDAPHIPSDNSLTLAVVGIPDSLCVANASAKPSSGGRVLACGLFHMRHSAIAAGVALLSFCNQPIAFARGSQIARDDPLNSERIERLPPEVRNAVIRMCEDHPPRAGHYFATYFENSRLIRLHFELLRCDGRATFCRSDSCLRQEYGLTDATIGS